MSLEYKDLVLEEITFLLLCKINELQKSQNPTVRKRKGGEVISSTFSSRLIHPTVYLMFLLGHL